MNMKIKLFTLFTTMAVLSFVIYQERFTLPSVNSAYANDDTQQEPQELERGITVPDFNFNDFKYLLAKRLKIAVLLCNLRVFHKKIYIIA